MATTASTIKGSANVAAATAIARRKFVKFDTTSTNGEIVAAAANETNPYGVITEEKEANDGKSVVEVELAGVGETKVLAGGAITAGAKITINASGEGVVAASGNQIVGVAPFAAADGSIFTMFWSLNGSVA